MAIPMIPNGMGYTEWSKTVHRPTNLKWIRKNSRMKKIKRIFI
jgi:hypothetical protein